MFGKLLQPEAMSCSKCTKKAFGDRALPGPAGVACRVFPDRLGQASVITPLRAIPGSAIGWRVRERRSSGWKVLGARTSEEAHDDHSKQPPGLLQHHVKQPPGLLQRCPVKPPPRLLQRHVKPPLGLLQRVKKPTTTTPNNRLDYYNAAPSNHRLDYYNATSNHRLDYYNA